MADEDCVVDFRLLGVFDVVASRRALDLGSARQRLLLAMLTVERNSPVGVDVLVEELWGNRPPADIGAGLQNFVSRARRALAVAGPGVASISAHGNGYRLEVDPARVDAERFGQLMRYGRDRVRAGAAAEAADTFRRALALWRGPALADLRDRPFARVEAARLDEARLEASEALAEALLAGGNPGEAVTVLEPLVVAEPFREGARGQLMIALYRLGRQADALSAYRHLRNALAEELGLEPGAGVRRLEQLILRQSPELDAPLPAVATSGTRPPAQTPTGSPMRVDTRVFLFTDIESSTRRWESEQEAMAVDLARHDVLLRAAVESRSGRVMSHTGDGLCAEFPTATDALHAALDAQRAVTGEPWRGRSPLRVRMGIHAGAAQARDGSYFGPTMNRAARLMSIAGGGQILCSQSAADLAWDALPADLALVDLGEHRLADLARPERVFHVSHPDLRDESARLTKAVTHPHNLPAAVSRFLGRKAELAELEDLVAAERMLTLWGPGGAGKTRLSLELAAGVAAGYPDGVWFVELAPLDRADLVGPAVMSALGMLAGGGSGATPAEELRRYLATPRPGACI